MVYNHIETKLQMKDPAKVSYDILGQMSPNKSMIIVG